jgi:hypothetical protein
VGINLGSVLLPALNTTVSYLRDGSAAVADFSKENPVLTKAIMLTAGGLIAAKVAAIGLGYGFTFIRGAYLSTVATWQAASAGMALMRARMLTLGATGPVLSGLWGAMTTKLVAVRSGMMAFGSRVIPVVISGMRALGVAAMANPIGLVIGGLALAAGLIITKSYGHFWCMRA